MNLLKLLRFDVALLKVFGLSSAVFHEKTDRFIYSRKLFVSQLVGTVLFFLIKYKIDLINTEIMFNKVNLTTHFRKLYNDSEIGDQKAAITINITIITLISAFVAYLWILIVLTRTFNRENYPKILNLTLSISRSYKKLAPDTNVDKGIIRSYFKRLLLMGLVQLMQFLDLFQPTHVFGMKAWLFMDVLNTIWMRLLFNHQLSVYDTWTNQVKVLKEKVHHIKKIEEMEMAHSILIKLIHTRRLIDKTFNIQFILDTVQLAMSISLIGYSYSVYMQSKIEGLLNPKTVFLSERVLLNQIFWINYSFHTVSMAKVELSKLVASFQKCSGQFKSRNSFYFFVGLGATKGVLSSHTTIGSVEMKTLFRIFGSVCSLVVIVHQFRQIISVKK